MADEFGNGVAIPLRLAFAHGEVFAVGFGMHGHVGKFAFESSNVICVEHIGEDDIPFDFKMANLFGARKGIEISFIDIHKVNDFIRINFWNGGFGHVGPPSGPFGNEKSEWL